MKSLADGTYEFDLTSPYGQGVHIRATVAAGQVTAWERNTFPSTRSEIDGLNLTAALAREVAARARLQGLVWPVQFTPTEAVAA